MRNWLPCAAMVPGILCASYAAAAEEASEAPPAVQQNQPTAAESGTTQAPDSGLAEIVVTAEKQSESAQRAPAAITVIDSTALVSRGVTDLRATETVIPSTKFALETNVVQVFMRGVGSQVDYPFIPEAVSLQMDGVFLPRYMSMSALYDVDRIEALPGPQGTLYGRSAIGGVINIETKRPTSDFNVDAVTEYGNYSTEHVTTALNLPVSNELKFRAAGDYMEHGGYNDNGTASLSTLNGRLSLLADPTENLSIFLWGGSGRSDGRPSPFQYVPYPGGRPYSFPPTDTASAFFYPPNGWPNDKTSLHHYGDQFGGQIDLQLGGLQLTYLPGYVSYNEAFQIIDVGLPVNAQEFSGQQFSNELRLSNASSTALSWQVGLYQYHTTTTTLLTFGPNLGGGDIPTTNAAYALFGQATYPLTDAIRVIAGGRASLEKLDAENAKSYFPILPTYSLGAVPFDYSNSWRHIDWKVGAEADVGPRSTLYLNAQTGFNPGTFQLTVPIQGQGVDPQKMLGVTAGSKNRLLDNQLQLNLEAFSYWYRDQIIQAIDVSSGSVGIYNAPRSRMYGLQFDGAWVATRQTRLTLNAGYLDAKITQYNSPTLDLSGFTLPDSPRLTVAAGLEQTLDLEAGGSIKFRANTGYNSGYWGTIDHQPDLWQKAFTKTDLSLTFYAAHERFDFGLWVKNLENNAAFGSAAITGRPPPFAGVVTVEPPRTFGARAHVNF